MATEIDLLQNEQLRKVRIAGDLELSRRCPGWFACMFHHAWYYKDLKLYTLTYSVQMPFEDEPVIKRITVGPVMMADGSLQWAATPNFFREVGY